MNLYEVNITLIANLFTEYYITMAESTDDAITKTAKHFLNRFPATVDKEVEIKCEKLTETCIPVGYTKR